MIVNESGGIPNRLFFRLFQTGNILQRQVQNEMGISAVQWAVLGALSREGFEDGTSFNQLKEYLYVSRQNLDGVLKRMERDGHVVRVPDPRGLPGQTGGTDRIRPAVLGSAARLDCRVLPAGHAGDEL